MRKKLFLISSLIFTITILMSPCLFAAYVDSNTGLYTFDSKLMGLWLSYDNGSTWYEVFSYSLANASTINIAVGDASAQMGSFFSGKIIPVGTITHIKARVVYVVTIKGWRKSGSNYYVTDSTVANTQTRNFGTSQPSESDCTAITLSAPPGQGDYMEQSQAVNIVVAEGATVNISIKFNLSNALAVSNYGGGNQITPSDGFQPTISQI